MAEMGIVSELSAREPDRNTLLALCSLAMLEGMDNQLLGASLFYNMGYNQGSLGLDNFKLAAMGALQGVMTNLMAPFWGMAADRGIMSQKWLMAIAAIGQGIATICLSLLTSYGPIMLLLRASNGVFLAGLRPLANGVVAKRTSTHLQGKIFSRVFVFIQLGTSVSLLLVTPLAGIRLFYIGDTLILGWRPAWMFVGFLSIAAAVLTLSIMVEEAMPEPKTKQGPFAILAEEFGLFVKFLRIPTFGIMVLQGIFGTIPWTVLWMATTFYQVAGMPAARAGLMGALTPFFAMIGVLLGGAISDRFQVKFGANGRPLTAQITIALGVPFMFFNFYGIDSGVAASWGGWWLYLSMNFGFGIFGQWAGAGCVWPILSQIVPEAYRSRVMAIEGAAENSIAAAVGPYFLAFIGDRLGFDAGSVGPGEVDPVTADKLGLSLTITVCAPWLLAFLACSMLHITAPPDLLAAREEEKALKESAEADTMKKRDSAAEFVSSRTFSATGIHA